MNLRIFAPLAFAALLVVLYYSCHTEEPVRGNLRVRVRFLAPNTTDFRVASQSSNVLLSVKEMWGNKTASERWHSSVRLTLFNIDWHEPLVTTYYTADKNVTYRYKLSDLKIRNLLGKETMYEGGGIMSISWEPL